MLKGYRFEFFNYIGKEHYLEFTRPINRLKYGLNIYDGVWSEKSSFTAPASLAIWLKAENSSNSGGRKFVTGDKSRLSTASHFSLIDGKEKAFICFDINPTTVSGAATILCVWSDSQYTITVERSFANLYVYVASTLTDGGSNEGHTTSSPLTAGLWSHIQIQFDGTQTGNANRLKVYVDGNQQSLTFTGTIPSVLTTSTSLLTVGRSDYTGSPNYESMKFAQLTIAVGIDFDSDDLEYFRNYNNGRSPGEIEDYLEDYVVGVDYDCWSFATADLIADGEFSLSGNNDLARSAVELLPYGNMEYWNDENTLTPPMTKYEGGSATVSRESTVVDSGTYAAKITVASYPTDQAVVRYLGTGILTANNSYSYSFRARSASGSLTLQHYPTGTLHIIDDEYDTYTGNGSYADIVTPGLALLSNGTAYIDNWSVVSAGIAICDGPGSDIFIDHSVNSNHGQLIVGSGDSSISKHSLATPNDRTWDTTVINRQAETTYPGLIVGATANPRASAGTFLNRFCEDQSGNNNYAILSGYADGETPRAAAGTILNKLCEDQSGNNNHCSLHGYLDSDTPRSTAGTTLNRLCEDQSGNNNHCGLRGYTDSDTPRTVMVTVLNKLCEDQSGNSNNARLSGYIDSDAPRTTHGLGAGVPGKAMTFDGTNKIIAHVNLNSYTEVTYSAWINSSNGEIGFGNDNGSWGRVLRSYDPGGGSLRLSVLYATGEWQTGVVIPIDEWFHLAVVWNTLNIKVYVNGSLSASKGSGEVGPYDEATVTYLGETGNGYYINGLIADPRIYSVTKDDTAISNIFNGGVGDNGADTTGLVCRLDFNEDQNIIVLGKSVTFDGVNDRAISNSVVSDISTARPLSAHIWFKHSAVSWRALMITSSNDAWTNGVGIVQMNSTNKLRFYVGNYSTQYAESDSSLNDNQWHSALGVWKADGTIELYIDGVLQTTTGMFTGTIGHSVLTIGADPGASNAGNDWYAGQLADSRIWNSDQSANAVTIHNGDSGSTGSPVFRFDFNEDQNITIPDKAVSFGGNQRAEFKQIAASATRTICAWVKLSNTLADQALFGDAHVNGPYPYGILFFQGTHVYGGGTTGQAGFAVNISSVFGSDWHHVAMVFTGGTIELFIDGVSQSVSAGGNGNATSLAAIGNTRWDTTQMDLEGLVADPRIYSVAKSPSEIAAIVAGDGGADITGLVFRFNFNEDQNATIAGQTLTFDGSGDHLISDRLTDLEFAHDDQFSIIFWLKPDSTMSDGYGNIIENRKSNNSGWYCEYDRTGSIGGAAKSITIDYFDGGAYWRVRTLHDTITEDAFQHCAIIYDGTGENGITFYINGTQTLAAVPYSGSPSDVSWDSSAIVRIGSSRVSSSADLKGSLANIVVTNTVLTKDEILAHMNGTTPVSAIMKLDFTEDQTRTITGQAVTFDGINDKIRIAYSELIGNPAFSFCVWAKIPTLSSIATIMGIGNADAVTCAALSVATDGSFGLGLGGSTNAFSAAGVVAANTWVHLAVVKSPGNINATTVLYLNGRLIALSSPASATPNIAANYTAIGTYPKISAGETFVAMQVAHPIIANTALTRDKVIAHMLGNAPASTVLEYTFAEPSPVSQEFGGSVKLDGINDYIPLSNAVAWNSGSTVAVWVKPDTLIGNQNLVADGVDTLNGIWLSNQYPQVSVVSNVSSPVEMLTEQWVHVVVTRSLTNLTTIYLNGVAVVAGTQTDTANLRQIGRLNNAYGRYISGNMSDLKAFASVLTAQQVLELYQGVSPGSETLDMPLDDGPQTGLINNSPVSFISYSSFPFSQSTVSKRPVYTTTGPGIIFDGADDGLVYTGSGTLSSNKGTLALAIKTGTLSGGDMVFFATSDTATSNNYLEFGVSASKLYIESNIGGTVRRVTGGTTLSNNEAYAVVYSSDGSSWSIYLEEDAETLVVTGANIGTWIGDISARDNLTLGFRKDTTENSWANFTLFNLLLDEDNASIADILYYLKTSY